jgi:GLPGLI family protein
MKSIIKLLVIVLFSGTTYAQDFQGVATYKTKRAIDIKMDSTQMNSEMQKQMMEMMKKQFEKTFKLSFNKEASVYKEEESLGAPSPQIGGSNMQFMVVGNGGGGDILYKNTKENRFTDQTDTFGKIFLVKDELKPIEWKLESDTKYIGEYQCYKATFTREVDVVSSVSFNSSSKVKEEDKDKEEKAPETKKEIQTVTAWYTPQIPVNNGPENYYGLPGLILEVNAGKQQIICSRIVLNPENKVDINEPTKGKEVNQAAFDKIMEKKNKEMRERFAPRNGSKHGEGIEIRIGG